MSTKVFVGKNEDGDTVAVPFDNVASVVVTETEAFIGLKEGTDVEITARDGERLICMMQDN